MRGLPFHVEIKSKQFAVNYSNKAQKIYSLKLQLKHRQLIFVIITVWLMVTVVFHTALLDSFHNHKPDFHHHDDCPAHQLLLALNAIVIVALFVLTLCASVSRNSVFLSIFSSTILIFCKRNRSPPFYP